MPQIKDFIAMGNQRHPESHLVIGPWAHGKMAVELDFGDKSKAERGFDLMRRFMHRQLKGDSSPLMRKPFSDNPFCLFIMQRNEWYGCDNWPRRGRTSPTIILVPMVVYQDCLVRIIILR